MAFLDDVSRFKLLSHKSESLLLHVNKLFNIYFVGDFNLNSKYNDEILCTNPVEYSSSLFHGIEEDSLNQLYRYYPMFLYSMYSEILVDLDNWSNTLTKMQPEYVSSIFAVLQKQMIVRDANYFKRTNKGKLFLHNYSNSINKSAFEFKYILEAKAVKAEKIKKRMAQINKKEKNKPSIPSN